MGEATVRSLPAASEIIISSLDAFLSTMTGCATSRCPKNFSLLIFILTPSFSTWSSVISVSFSRPINSFKSSCSISPSASIARYQPCRCQKTGPRHEQLLLNLLYIFTGPRIDLKNIAFHNMKGHLDHRARFKFCRLVASGGRVAPERRISLYHLQFDKHGRLPTPRLVLVVKDGHDHIFLDEFL